MRKNSSNGLSIIGNIIWIILGGLITSLAWVIIGLVLMITIIGIPFGLQCFKFASLSLCPFGKNVETNFGAHPIMNVIWLILFGWEMAIQYVIVGIINCITIIGIPFGLQSFKLAVLSLIPFGAKIN